MKLAFVCPKYNPSIGGVETHVREIAERLIEKGHMVEVLTTNFNGKLPKEDRLNGVKIKRFRTFLTPEEKYHFAPGIYFHLKNHHYDVVHAHNYHSLPALFASFATGSQRFIFTPHFHDKQNSLYKLYKPFGAQIFNKAEKVICVSSHEMKHIKVNFKVSRDKLIKIPNGINFNEFQDVNPVSDIDNFLLYVGRLHKSKGVQYVIQLLEQLQNHELVIIGKGSYKSALKHQARNLGVSSRIYWFSDLPRCDLLSYYKSASVFLMLSRYEAYGITVAEALASGTPCVVANGSALEDFVDGKSCIGLATPIKMEELKNAVLQLEKITAPLNPNLSTWDESTQELLTKVYIK